jgi:rSAM/selenodomain-associated transferase 1
MNLRSRLTGVATGDQATFIERAVFQRIGGYPDVPLMEDVMISKTLRKLSPPACIAAPVICSSRRWQQHGIMTTIWLMWRLRLAFYLGASPASLHAQYYPGRTIAPAKPPDPEHWRYPQARILFFAKAPVAGRVKTRLQPLLGEAGALALHQKLIGFGWHQLTQAALAPMQLWASDAGGDAFFATLDGVSHTWHQTGHDLGERMHHATVQALSEADFVVVVGADCPSVDAVYVEQALALLAAGEPVVLGPAEDGGYVLIGLRSPTATVFQGIDWGQSSVMQQTRERLQASGISWRELAIKWDVDRPEDLARLNTLPDW